MRNQRGIIETGLFAVLFYLALGFTVLYGVQSGEQYAGQSEHIYQERSAAEASRDK